MKRTDLLTQPQFFLILLLGSFLLSIIFEAADWLHYFMVSFSIYSVITLIIPVLKKPKTDHIDESYRPFVSIIIPARNEALVIANTIQSALQMSYYKDGVPNFEIIAVNDASTDSTGSILDSMAKQAPNLIVLHRESGKSNGKSSALNAGLSLCKGEVIAVFDADTRIEPGFLNSSIPLFSSSSVGGVQGRVEIYNPHINTVTMLQKNEFTFFNHLVQQYKDIIGGLAGLGGNGQLVKYSVLHEVGGWNEQSLTEDFDLTLRMLLKGYSVRYASNAIVWQEAVETWHHLLKQRTRWGQGLLQCFFDYFLKIMAGRFSLVKKLDILYTMARVIIPFGILEGHALYLMVSLDLAYFNSSFPPELFTILPFIMFGIMYWTLTKESPYRGVETVFHVLSYWLYSFIWVIVIPFSFINHLKVTTFIHWDKTDHKGLNNASQSQSKISISRFQHQ